MPATYEPINTTTLGSAQASVTFSSIPTTYTDLVLVCFARTERAATSDNLLVRLNSDSTAIYSATDFYGDTAQGSARSTGNTSWFWAYIPSASQTAGTFGTSVMHINDYANTTTFKSAVSTSANANAQVETTANLYRSTSAISSITLLSGTASNLSTGSTFTLFGVKAA